MLKKSITFEDFNGNKRTKEYYFNLSTAEVVEMETSVDGGYADMLKRIIAATDANNLIKEFKAFILAAIGEKSEDGEYFTKNDDIRNRFASSPAYSELFVELASNANSAAEFFIGVLPAEFGEHLREAADKASGAVDTSPPVLPPPSFDPPISH